MKKRENGRWAALLLGTGMSLPMLMGGAAAPANSESENVQNAAAQNVIPQVPGRVTFAGEEIDLRRSDLRERMDRELISFTYGHTNTLLILKRANRIFPIVEPILKECGLPDDLKYLMTIESNLDTRAYSTARAAGLWQFIEETGRRYGLEVNRNIDERYNTKKATRAACRYLKESYGKFGDWMTVAASYNAGPAGIERQLAAQQQGRAFDLWLNAETSRYMFRILAVKLIMEQPRQYGFYLQASDLYPCIAPLRVDTVKSEIANLADYAKKRGLTLSQLREANLWLRENSLQNKTGRTYCIEIPDAAALSYDPAKTRAHNPAWVGR